MAGVAVPARAVRRVPTFGECTGGSSSFALATPCKLRSRRAVLAAAAQDNVGEQEGEEKELGELLEVNREDDPGESRVRVRIGVPEVVLEALRREVLDKVAEEVELPGFRNQRGAKSPPDELVVNTFGYERAMGYLCEYILKATLPYALNSVAAKAYDGTETIETPYEDIVNCFSGRKLEPRKKLEYTASVLVRPQLRWTGSLQGKEIEVEVDRGEEEDEEAVRTAVEEARKSRGTLRVANRGLQRGDIAVMDVEPERVRGGGKEADALLQKQEKYRLDTGRGDLNLPGFVDALEGMEVGEEREFELDFPEDWGQEALQGVRAKFKTTMREVLSQQLADETEELAEDIWPGASSLEEAKERAKQANRESREDQAAERERRAVEEAAERAAEAEAIPDELKEMVAGQMLGEKLVSLQAQGAIGKEDAQQLATQERAREILNSDPDAVQREAKRQIVVHQLAEEMGISVPEEELDQESAQAAQEVGGEAEDLRERLHEILLRNRTLDHLREMVSFKRIPSSN